MENTKMSANYAKLTQFLLNKKSECTKIRVPFSEIEEMIGAPLPSEALEYRTWWINSKSEKNPQAAGWIDAGYMVMTTKFNENWVEFLKVS